LRFAGKLDKTWVMRNTKRTAKRPGVRKTSSKPPPTRSSPASSSARTSRRRSQLDKAPSAVERVEHLAGVTYQLKLVRCNNRKCKACARARRGEGVHGPYWYAYTKRGNRTRCTYVGKELPPAVASSLREMELGRAARRELGVATPR